jgi:hypothetical protein
MAIGQDKTWKIRDLFPNSTVAVKKCVPTPEHGNEERQQDGRSQAEPGNENKCVFPRRSVGTRINNEKFNSPYGTGRVFVSSGPSDESLG